MMLIQCSGIALPGRVACAAFLGILGLTLLSGLVGC